MIRLLTVCLALLLASCSDDPDVAIRERVDQFLHATTTAEILETTFIPNGLDQAKVDRMTKQVTAAISAPATKPGIHGIEVRGRWAHIKLTNATPGFTDLLALKTDEEWQIFWDPSGTLAWGKQEWHSLLSEADWADYHSLKKKIGEQAGAPNP